MDSRLSDHCPLCDAPLKTHEAMTHVRACMKIQVGLDAEGRAEVAARTMELRAEVQRAEAAEQERLREEARRRRAFGWPPE